MRSASDAKPHEEATDEIDSLPGAPKLLSKHYSGFLSISASKSIHYYYVESERSPESDSIVFWTNGGPGCSGLLGLFVELGPWRPQSDGSLVRNPHSWTSLASIVFLEQPAGVGFSTTTDPSELETNDYNAARDNVATIREFFKRHPERANNKMYLASESYGGHYIPQLTVALLADAELSKNFDGFLIGNPYTSYASGDLAMAQTLWGLQLVQYPLWLVPCI
jgi:carboxypeptidase C (cathepsin A)